MIQGKIVIDQRRKSKNGFPAKIHISGYGQRKMLSTGIYTGQPRYQREIKIREAELIKQLDFCNENGLNFDRAVKYVMQGGRSKMEILKQQIRELEGASKVYPFMETFIKELEASGKSTRMMKQTLKQFQDFAPDLYFSDVTYEFLSNFVIHKYKEGCGSPGVSVYLRTLRTVYLEAQRRESINTPSGNPFLNIIPKARKKQVIGLSKADLKKIIEYTPKKSTTEKNKDKIKRRLAVFLFQIYIGGHDLADVSRLRWKDVKGDRVRFTRFKNRNRETVVIDNILVPEALEIIKEYGTPDLERVFSWIPITGESYRNYAARTRRVLKEVSNDLELPKLTTKSPRYIFKTWAGEAGVNFEVVMQIMGHKGAGVPFGYQARFNNDIVDEVLKTVLKVS